MDSVRFDGVAREIAAGTSRRQAFKLIGGSVAGGFLALYGAEPAGAERCRRVGERCDKRKQCCVGVCCGGVCCPEGQVCQDGRCVTPPPPVTGTGPNRQICVCGDGTVLNICADLDCASGAAQDAICGPACVGHGGEAATGCIVADPACA
jgi:hypothetical protein